jgi:hypothetical protein
MRKDEVEQDAEYALAKASKIWKSKGQNDVMENGKKEEQNINQEINKLKQQLEREKTK